MPLIDGVSVSTLELFVFLSPSPRRIMRSLSVAGRFLRVTFIFFSILPYLLELLSAKLSHARRAPELRERVHGGLDNVMRVVGPKAFREHVGDADRFDYGPHPAAGYYAGTGGRRPEEDPAHDDYGVETEPLSAFDDLGDPVEVYELVLKLQGVYVYLLQKKPPCWFRFGGNPKLALCSDLKVEPRLASAFSEGLYPAVIYVSRPVEDHLANALLDGNLCNRLADLLRRLDLLGIGAVEVLHLGRCRRDRGARDVIYYLRVDVFVGPTHVEPGPLGLASLAGLSAYYLFSVLDALALVRLGLPERPYVRRHLAHELLVRALEGYARLLVYGGAYALGQLVLDGVRVPEREVQDVALNVGLVSHAHDVEPLLEALGDALDHVGYERPGEPVDAPRGAG